MSQSTDDPALPAFEEAADSLDRAASDTAEAARHVRRLRSERLKGRPWREVLGRKAARNLLDLLASATSQSSSTVGRLRRAIVDALRGDGLRVGEIADALGVSHQRISRIRGNDRASVSPPDR
jgi:hypothetical protein